MANIKSQKKRVLTNAKAEARNRAVRSEVKTRLKKARETGAEDDVRAAIKAVDTAARKKVIHKNKAARTKSRLVAHVAAQ